MSPLRVTQNMDKFASNKFDIQQLSVALHLKFIEKNLFLSPVQTLTSPVSSEAKNLTDWGAASELRIEKLLYYKICRWASIGVTQASLLVRYLTMWIWKKGVAKTVHFTTNKGKSLIRSKFCPSTKGILCKNVSKKRIGSHHRVSASIHSLGGARSCLAK